MCWFQIIGLTFANSCFQPHNSKTKMKKILLSVFLLAATVSAKAQAPTTQEEYNYATKGIAIQRASGLDMKQGYTLTNRTGVKARLFDVTLEDLVRNNDKSLAGIVVQIQNPQWSAPLYMCIPNPTAAQGMQEQYYLTIENLQAPTLKALSIALSLRAAAKK